MNCDVPFCSVLCLEQEEQRMSFSLISNEVPIKARKELRREESQSSPESCALGLSNECAAKLPENSSKLQTQPEHTQTNSASL